MKTRRCTSAAGSLRRHVRLSLLRVALLALLCATAAEPAHAQAYQAEIERWTAQDQLDPPPRGAVLFVGSSSIRRWEHLSRDFHDYDVIQRGFGGSQLTDVVDHIDHIVLPYEPSAIVLFEGTNDIASGKSPAVVFDDFVAFVDTVLSELPDTHVLFIGITPTAARWDCCWQASAEVNTLVERFARTHRSVHYVDTPSRFLALGAPESPEFSAMFCQDRLHLNEAGYEVWTHVIGKELRAVMPPSKSPPPTLPILSEGSRILVDFGPSNPEDGDATVSPDPFGQTWNNWYPVDGGTTILAGEHIGGLVTMRGERSEFGLVITGEFSNNGKRNGGLADPRRELLGNLSVPSATVDFLFSSDENLAGGYMLRGLDPGGRYDLAFFASRNHIESRVTRYIVHGRDARTAELETSGEGIGHDGTYDGNDDSIARIIEIAPDRFGQLFVDVQRASNSFAYVGAMELTVRSLPARTSYLPLASRLSSRSCASTWSGASNPSVNQP